MPTTQPLDDDVLDGGQLKPIDAMTNGAPPAGAPAAPQPAQTPHPAQTVPQNRQATPAHQPPSNGEAHHAGGIKRVMLRMPGAAATHPAGNTAQNTGQVPQTRAANYSDTDFAHAWTRFMDDNAVHHLLVNTMRACTPVRTHDGTWLMTVESDIQTGIVNENLGRLVTFLRDTLDNDTVKVETEVRQGQASPRTWNERQVLADMLEHYPHLAALADTLKLTLG